MPLYSSNRSKHSFTQHQLLVLAVLRRMLVKSYRELAKWEIFTTLADVSIVRRAVRRCLQRTHR